MASGVGPGGTHTVIQAGAQPMVGVLPSPTIPGAVPTLVPASSAAATHLQHQQPNSNVPIISRPVDGIAMTTAPANVTAAVAAAGGRPVAAAGYTAAVDAKVLDKKRLQELVKEVDPLEQLDEDVEEMLLQIADDFIDNVVTAACQIAKHRKANTVEVKDVQLHLERNWNMWIPGFGSEELKPFKKSSTTEAHKQRMALIRKTLKKY